MKLHTLKKSKGLINKSKRLGRGNGSGKGNYSAKGLKGQKARSGHSMKPFFEGGQTSIVQRIPKAKGFKRHYKLIQEYSIVNLGVLDADERIENGMKITKQLLWDFGYIKSPKSAVKILGDGDFTKTVEFVEIEKISTSAQQKIANPSAKSEKKVVKKIVKEEAPKKVKSVEVKVEAKEETAPKAAVKKPVAKKETAPKAAVKKPAAKKETAPKAVAKKPAAKKTTKKD